MMLKFFLSGILVTALIAVAAPQASIIIAIVAGLGLAAIGIEAQGKRQGNRRKARKTLPKLKARKV
jgi:hypothetical protein